MTHLPPLLLQKLATKRRIIFRGPHENRVMPMAILVRFITLFASAVFAVQVQGPHGPLLLLHPGYVQPYRKPHRLPQLPCGRARGNRHGDGQGPPVLHGRRVSFA